jgi:hypothetical protein
MELFAMILYMLLAHVMRKCGLGRGREDQSIFW